MKMVIQVLLSAGAIAGLLVIAHYIVLALNKPEELLSFLANIKSTVKEKIYYGILYIGWMAFAYFGAKGLLFWLPASIGSVNEYGDFQPLKDMLALMLSFLSLPLLGSIEEFARNKVRGRYLENSNAELESIVTEVSQLHSKTNRYEELRKNAGNWDQQHYYDHLHWLTEQLEAQIDALIKSALNEEKRKRESELERDAEKVEAAKRKADLARQLQDYRNALDVATNRTLFNTIRSLEGMDNASQYLIDASLVAQKWHTLETAADAILDLSEPEINNGTKTPFSINSLFEACVGISVIAPLTIVAAYSGDSHGGSTEMFVEIDGSKQTYLNALTVENSIDALIEGLYVTFELPKKGAFWHGFYGRDYNFLFDNNQLIEVLRNQLRIPPDANEIGKIDRPCGVRICKSDSIYRVSSLAAYPNGAIVDMTVSIDNRRLVVEPEDKIVNSSSQYFY